MTFSHTIPPIYDDLKKTFGISWDDGIIIAFGDTIHSKHPIPEDFVIHESTHLEQQKELGAKKWYEKYIQDPLFRLREETEAYQNQARFIMSHVKDKNTRFKMISRIWNDISSPIYGNMISRSEAQKLIPYK